MAANAVNCDGLRAFDQLMSPVIEDLCFKNEPGKKVDDILGLLIMTHTPMIDTITVPRLIRCLWTDDADNRLRIHQTLMALQKADYSNSLAQKDVDAFKSWVPGKDEKPADLAQRIRAWSDWWGRTPTRANTGCAPPPSAPAP